MADNVQITPGTGNTIGADEVTDGTLGVVKVQYVKLMDGTLNGINKAAVSSGGAILVDGTATVQPVSGTVTITPSGTQNVTVTNASGASSVNIQDGGNSITVDGTVSANAGTGNFTVVQATGTNLHAVLDSTSTTTVTQATGTNLHTVVDSGTLTAVTAITNALPAGTNVLGVTGVTQASTTSGQSGPLMQGAVTTSAPLYTTAKTNPLSLNVNGGLRVGAALDLGNTSANFSNQGNVSFINNDAGDVAPLWVLNSYMGGAFSGTTDAARRGTTLARTPTVFRTVSATATGNTAVWTAGTGNKWRLLKYYIEVTGNANLAAGAVVTIKFQDVTTDINLTHSVFIPTTSVTTGLNDYWATEWIDLGYFGILAAATATALNINLSATLTTGNVRVIVAGTEE